MTNLTSSYSVTFPAAQLTLLRRVDDQPCDREGDATSRNEPIASHVDAALCDVADYLRANGICHPDVIQNCCRALVDEARQDLGHDSPNQGGIALRLTSLRLAAEWIGKLHDDLIVGSVTPTQHYIVKFDDVISDPWLLKRNRLQQQLVKDQICRRICRIIPNAQRQPMRPTETPALIGPLRREWWTTKATRSWVSFRSTAEAFCRVVVGGPISNAR